MSWILELQNLYALMLCSLISVEEELRREQAELMGMMKAKQKVIDAQEKKIETLNLTNQRLLATLAQLKENAAVPVRNRNGSLTGRTSPYPSGVAARDGGLRNPLEVTTDAMNFLNLPESKELRSSSC